MNVWLLLLFVMASGAAKGISDAFMFERMQDWQNKYSREPESGFLVERPRSGLYGWYHRAFGLGFRERFLFAGTALVAFTDGFHFFDSLRQSLVFGAIATATFLEPLPASGVAALIALLWVARSAGFHASHQLARKKLAE